MTLRCVLQDDCTGLLVVMDPQIVAAMQAEGVAVGPVQLGDGVPARDAARVARDRDDVFEDDIVGQHAEVVAAVDESAGPLLDDVEERLEGFEVFKVAYAAHRSSSVALTWGDAL